jgi:SagB-type dehydrogenase family enzyme
MGSCVFRVGVVVSNRDVQAAWSYHNATKHSYRSVRNNPHYLDWANQPLPFKVYPELEPIALPREAPQTGVAALSAIAESLRPDGVLVPSLSDLSRILYFSAGITKQRQYPGGELYFRAAACTGALYEVELYLVCRSLPELEAGVYHFTPAEFGLRRLRSGDFRGLLAEASGGNERIARAPATIVCTGTYWRNAWKYQARTYRHFGWDNGTILANLLALCSALELPAHAALGFVDSEVNRLLDLDTDREVAFSLVAIGSESGGLPLPPPAGPLGLKTLPYSRHEVDYPAMREMHAASSLAAAGEARAWRQQVTPEASPQPAGSLIPLESPSEEETPRDPIERTILRRGSTRQFARAPISFAQLSAILERASRGFAADFHNPSGALMNELYLIVNAVEGLQPGAYYFHRERGALELLKEGDFRRPAAYLGLEQDLPGDAAANIFFIADLNPILERYGNRGYRAVQLEAGTLGGKLYLAAYAQRLGATGLTFYDDDVTGFFSPHAQGKSAIFMVCLGKSAKQQLIRP